MRRRPRLLTSIRCHFAIACPSAPMKRGLSNQRKPAEQAEHRARRDDGREHGDHRADQEHEREALHLGGRDGEQHERRDRRDDVRVDDRMEALLVAGRDRGAGRLPGPHLFLDAFEDDDVRIGRDADREDQAGEAGQRQRDVEDEDRRVHERDVDGEAGDGHEPEQAVEDDQEERDDEQADDARRSSPPGASPCRAWPRRSSALDLLERDRQAHPSGARARGPSPRRALPMFSICAEPPPMPSESVRSFGSICGHDLISRSSTIAKCCGAPRKLPRCQSRRVMSWKRFSPSPVNAIVTIGWPNWSKSWRVPSALMCAPGHLGNRVLGVVRLVAEEVVVRPARREVRRARLLLGRSAGDDDGVASATPSTLPPWGTFGCVRREERLAACSAGPSSTLAVLSEEVVRRRVGRRRAALAAQELEQP